MGWFEKNKDVATLQRMARRAGVPFHTSTVKSKLARAIMEREALIRPAPSASGARGQAKGKSGGGAGSEWAWFVGEVGGRLQMRKCSRAEVEK